MANLSPAEEVAQIEQYLQEACESVKDLADALQGLWAHWGFDGMAEQKVPRRTDRRLLLAVEVCRQAEALLEGMALDLEVEWHRLSQWPGPQEPAGTPPARSREP